MALSLFGEELVLDNLDKTKKIIKKLNDPKDTKVSVSTNNLKSKKLSTEDKIKTIEGKVYSILGKQINNTCVIKTQEDLINYIDKAITKGVIAVDTETNNSLDPITCKLMGLCLYTPGEKQAYIPVNHVDFKTGERLSEQLLESVIGEELKRLVDSGIKIIMHNGKFDFEVLLCTCGVEVMCHWDTLLASKLLDENEKAGLKSQYISKIDSEQEHYDIEDLFEKQEYAVFPPEVFALYAATDAMMTYKLYKWQEPIMNSDDYKDIKYVFFNVEMPCMRVVADMELNGVEIDSDYSSRLSTKYHKLLDNLDEKINFELSKLQPQIDAWRLSKDANEHPKKYAPEKAKSVVWDENSEKEYIKKWPEVDESGKRYKLGKSKNEQLEEKINLGSPSQLAILLYDILKVGVIDNESPRGTGADILEKIDLYLCKLLLERREVVKLLDGYIDVLPNIAKDSPDGRIRTHFNQYGADTGRFSSSNPINLQNIPSHNKEIRMLFKARDGYTLVGSDFSAQEPRILSQLSGDENMITSYKEGKDLYATIASSVYHNAYWDNMEHHEDGTPNPEGKKRRSSCKSILLGIMYSRGAQAIAEQIGSTKENAQTIIDNFFKSFSKVKDIIDASHDMAREKGYVTDLWGRRRRLPDIQLPRFEIKVKDTGNNKNEDSFNPFFGCCDRVIENKLVDKYLSMLNSAKSWKEVNEIIELAKKHNFEVIDNRVKIAQAERQCLNARIQGSAATMTKIAMIKLFNDKELNDLGFKLLIGVHDELIGECPKENAEKVADRLTYVMKTCVAEKIVVPFKCDADVCDHWYYNDYCDTLRQTLTDMVKSGIDRDGATRMLIKEHSEMLSDDIRKILLEEN